MLGLLDGFGNILDHDYSKVADIKAGQTGSQSVWTSLLVRSGSGGSLQSFNPSEKMLRAWPVFLKPDSGNTLNYTSSRASSVEAVLDGAQRAMRVTLNRKWNGLNRVCRFWPLLVPPVPMLACLELSGALWIPFVLLDRLNRPPCPWWLRYFRSSDCYGHGAVCSDSCGNCL